jgi:hypothetical protein
VAAGTRRLRQIDDFSGRAERPARFRYPGYADKFWKFPFITTSGYDKVACCTLLVRWSDDFATAICDLNQLIYKHYYECVN